MYRVNPAPRIDFGKVVHRPGKEGNYFFTHGTDGHDFPPAHHNRISQATAAQVRQASLLLDTDTLPGPFSDSDGQIADLGRIIFQSCKGIDEKVARLAATLNSDRFFRFYPDMIGEDKAFSAPDMLRESRLAKDAGSGDCARLFGNILEPYLFGTAILRSSGIRAFPAFAILHSMPKEEHSPVLAILDDEGTVPLRTMSLLYTHPPMHHLALLDDRSSRGLTYVMLAENRMKELGSYIMEEMGKKKAPSDAKLSGMADSISDALLCSELTWPNNLFVSHSIRQMGDQLFQKLSFLALGSGIEGAGLQRMLESAARFSAGMMGRIEEAFENKKRMNSGTMH